MPGTIDWSAIREAYEHGVSKQALSIKHLVSRQAILKRARKEKWITPIVPSPDTVVPSPVTSHLQSPVNSDEPSTVEKAIRLISERLDEQPENKDIKMLMDSLSQAYKIKLLAPQDEQNASAYDMREFVSHCTPEELAIVKPIMANVAARKAAEEEAKLKPIRRIG